MNKKVEKPQTIGLQHLDLVNVKPTGFPRIDLCFLDFIYDNAKFEKKSNKPKGQIFSDNDPYGEEIWE